MLAENGVKERLFYQTFDVIVFFRKKDGLSSLSGSTVSSGLKGLFMDSLCGVSVKAATDGDWLARLAALFENISTASSLGSGAFSVYISRARP